MAKAAEHDGPPIELIERGLMLELEDGMRLHEAIRTRLLRDVGNPLEDRSIKLRNAFES